METIKNYVEKNKEKILEEYINERVDKIDIMKENFRRHIKKQYCVYEEQEGTKQDFEYYQSVELFGSEREKELVTLLKFLIQLSPKILVFCFILIFIDTETGEIFSVPCHKDYTI